MKERPILFSTEMVQAILAGRKTMTRRARGLKVVNFLPGEWKVDGELHHNYPEFGDDDNTYVDFVNDDGQRATVLKFPYGQIGDVLWVRETFIDNDDYPCYDWEEEGATQYSFKTECPEDQWKNLQWKPSIHMPKAAARIWLEITDIRVERVQEISEEDACAEGIGGDKYDELWEDYSMGNDPERFRFTEPSESFQSLWQKINGPESWQANPFCWAITFKVLSTTGKPENI